MGSGDPMLHNKVRLAALAGCAIGVLVMAGCGAREPVEAPPASSAPGYGAAQTPELMGAAPAAEGAPADGLLGGPAAGPAAVPAPVPVFTSNPKLKTWRRADGVLVTAMDPIANPKARRSVRYAPRAVAAPARRTHAAPVAHAVAQASAKPAPVAHAVAQASAKPAPVAKPAPKPVAVAPAPAALKPVAAPTPVPVIAKAPVVAPPVKTETPKPLTKLQKLQAAVAPEATKGAVLASGESLAQGKAGQVTLSLPATLGDMIKKEAAKLGLTKAARKTSAYADLQGEGYEITPNGRQTAVVKSGEAPTFAWQVKPTPAAKGSLKTEFGVELNGAKPAQGFSLGSIAKQVAPIQDAVTEKTKGFKLGMPSLGGFETIDLPGVGKVPGKSLLGGALVLLALAILVAISRSASANKTRAERRRKFRTLTDYGRNEMDYEAPRPVDVGYVNPMVAAAGGAMAATAVSQHDDHGRHVAPAPEEHKPFEMPAPAPRHDDHGHDDHGVYAAPAERHVAPVAGAEALPVSGHDHAAAHAEDHGQEAHGTEAPNEPAKADHADDHGHDAPTERKELEHAH
uniref:Stalk-specific protein X n=1 Tax=Caulobacter sp. (strain K31) TaxID=366602 RepID=B0T1H7_CAUSK